MTGWRSTVTSGISGGNGPRRANCGPHLIFRSCCEREFAACGKKFPPEELTLDHIVPVARGGRSTRGNLAVCCRACNQAKKFLTPAELLLRNLESENDGGDNG